jgi:hypothetical protein
MERTAMTGRRRALLGMAALLLLLVAVAVASTGSVPSGSGGTRRPADELLDVAISLYLLLMVFGIGLWIYLLAVRKDVVAESILARRGKPRWPAVLTLAVVFAVLAVFVRWLSVDEELRRRIQSIAGRTGNRTPPGGKQSAADAYQPHFATGPVLVVLGLLVVVGVAWYLSYRAHRRRLPPLRDSLLPTLAEVLDETIDDLRAEEDPRRAVIAAYARMERAFAAYGLPRSPAEAPDEYLHRILSDLEVSRRATSRLTALFAWAKFSGHDVAPEMKDDAIDALVAVRTELHAAEILAEQRRLEGIAAARERAGA